MRVSQLRSVAFMAAISYTIGGFAPALGQVAEGTGIGFELLAEEALPAADPQAQRFVLVQDKNVRVASLSAKEGQRTLSIQEGPQMILPRDLPALVARDGGTILQYGDERDLSHPRVTSLHWLNSQGEEVGALQDYFTADAVLALADDGYTAVVGARADERQGKVVSLFDAGGQRLWERALEQGRDTHAEPLVTRSGDRVAIITTNAGQPLEGHRLLVLGPEGREVASIRNLGLLHRLVAVNQGRLLFVEAQDQQVLVDLATGEIKWRRPSRLRLVSPTAAASAPDGSVLFLLVVDWPGRPQPAYQWQLRALDADSGEELGAWELPKAMPSTRAEVFGSITEDRLTVLRGPDRLSISWKR
jgi:hypothetical protein